MFICRTALFGMKNIPIYSVMKGRIKTTSKNHGSSRMPASTQAKRLATNGTSSDDVRQIYLSDRKVVGALNIWRERSNVSLPLFGLLKRDDV